MSAAIVTADALRCVGTKATSAAATAKKPIVQTTAEESVRPRSRRECFLRSSSIRPWTAGSSSAGACDGALGAGMLVAAVDIPREIGNARPLLDAGEGRSLERGV